MLLAAGTFGELSALPDTPLSGVGRGYTVELPREKGSDRKWQWLR